MHVRRLTLNDFRNYRHLDLEAPSGLLLLVGRNAQGKTNLLEAIHLVSTVRSPRATGDVDLINWQAAGDGDGVARIVAEAQRLNDAVRVEMAIRGPDEEHSRSGKRLRLNGVPQRAAQVVGQISSVLFTPQDLDLIGGPPTLRRRFLDLMLSQVDGRYLAVSQTYAKIVVQRNALLRRIREGTAHLDELVFWDTGLADAGSYIIAARTAAMQQLAPLAASAHRELSGDLEDLRLIYEPRWVRDWNAGDLAGKDRDTLAAAFLDNLVQSRQQETGAGVSLWGPHRDDLVFLIDERSAAAFASRAQWRTAALALRLAEARFLLSATGDHPVLLLDDVLSEMDDQRRRAVLDALAGFDQVWITSAEEEYVRGIVPAAHTYLVREGQVSPA
jgi:DNA replication and repair protein RecF